MNKFFGYALFLFAAFASPLFAEDVVGFWKSVDEKTGKPQSIVGIYEYQGKYYGRLIVTFNDQGGFSDTIYDLKERAPGVVGNPYYAGLDFIYDLKKNGSKYTDGRIMDPEEGRVYDAEIWLDKGNLIVRGEIWIFGRNQTWPPALEGDFPPNFKKPDLKKFVPKILEAKLVSDS